MKKILTLLPLICCSLYVLGQGLGTISGSVTDKNLLTAIPGATVSLEGTPLSAITDTLGRFRITGVPPKTYTLKISVVGYTTAVFYNLVLTSGNETNLSVQMEPKSQTLEEVLVKNRKTAVAASLETPLSVQKLTAEEIRSNPGGNFDISRVIQALPGVGGTLGRGLAHGADAFLHAEPREFHGLRHRRRLGHHGPLEPGEPLRLPGLPGLRLRPGRVPQPYGPPGAEHPGQPGAPGGSPGCGAGGAFREG